MTQQKPFQKLTAIPHCGDKALRAMEDTICLHKAGTQYCLLAVAIPNELLTPEIYEVTSVCVGFSVNSEDL